MARHIPLLGAAASGTFTVGVTAENVTGDWAAVFTADSTFDIGGDTQYNGQWTVVSSSFVGNQTVITVQGTVAAPVGQRGYITNTSNIYVAQPGGTAVVVPKEQYVTAGALTYPGRGVSGWGEAIHQNLALVAQSFAALTPPTLPLVGQLWYDMLSSTLKVYNGSTWTAVQAVGGGASYRHQQGTASTTWTITHGLGAQAPYVVNASFFVDTGGGVFKPIIPSDVTYVSTNQLTVSFTNAYIGYALVRL